MTNLVQPKRGEIAFRAIEDKTTSSEGVLVDAQQELEWESSLRNLEHVMNTYKSRSAEDAISESDAEQVAEAMEQVGSSHTDPTVKTHWREKAKEFRGGGARERDGILEDIGRGFLTLLTTPFLLVGAALQAAGGILSGVGSILRGLGRLTKKLTDAGSSKKRETEDSAR